MLFQIYGDELLAAVRVGLPDLFLQIATYKNRWTDLFWSYSGYTYSVFYRNRYLCSKWCRMGTEQRYLCTYDKLVPLCKIVCCNSRVYWFYDAEIQWGIGKTEWFKVFPFAIVAINILIAVVSDLNQVSVDSWQ